MEEEHWKVYGNREISSFGRVRFLNRDDAFYPMLEQGYAIFLVDGHRRRVHDVMAECFLTPRPSQQHTVDHIDRDKANNHISNLRWATHSEQMMNRVIPMNKAGCRPVEVNFGDGWHQCESVMEAVRTYGFNRGSLGRVLRGDWPTVNGAEVRYLDANAKDEEGDDNSEDDDGEEWKLIDGHGVSSHGRVHGSRWKHRYTPKPSPLNGYSKAFGQYVHVLVMAAFGPPKPSEEHTIDHINRCKHDNRIENLRWATKIEQNANQKKHKQRIPTLQRKVQATFPDGSTKAFESVLDAAKWTKVDARRVTEAAKGKAWNKNDRYVNKGSGIRFEYSATRVGRQFEPVIDKTREWMLPSDSEDD